MPRQYVIENGTENNRWLCKIESVGKEACAGEVRSFRPGLENALVIKSQAEAVALAKRARGRAWQLKGGEPVKLVWPK